MSRAIRPAAERLVQYYLVGGSSVDEARRRERRLSYEEWQANRRGA